MSATSVWESGEAPSGERLRGKSRHCCNLQVTLCDPCPSDLRVRYYVKCAITYKYTYLYLYLMGMYTADSN